MNVPFKARKLEKPLYKGSSANLKNWTKRLPVTFWKFAYSLIFELSVGNFWGMLCLDGHETTKYLKMPIFIVL